MTRVRIATILSTALACVVGAQLHSATAPSATWPPIQLEMRVPFEPTAFPSAGRTYLAYELHLRNFGRTPLTLERVEVFAADAPDAAPMAAFDASALDELLQPLGAQSPAGTGSDRRTVAAGASAVLFVWLSLDGASAIPGRLHHRVLTGAGVVDAAAVGTRHIALRVLGPPLTGADWQAESGPSNDSYHRRGILVLDGLATIDRRYAIDWMQVKNGVTFSDDPLDNRSYFSYGKEVLAVAAGRVLSAKEGIPDNVPRHEGFRPAVPITMETLAGNTITLNIGGGQFVYYMHLQPGSLRVRPGDYVKRGQVLARVGNSGDARGPHLHLEVTTSPRLLAGEGVPYLIDQYLLHTPDGTWQLRRRELPLSGMLIDFGPGGPNSN